jgi:molecular chaperone Hsp33
MLTKDTLQRFIFEKAPIRGEFIHLQESFQTIVNQHAYPPPIRKLLGEALCVAGLLSAIIKFKGRLTVQFRGKGRLKLLLAQCDDHFHLRGLVKWEGELSYEDLMDSFNDGVLVIMLDAGPTKSRYQGIVAWRGNSLAESIEGYFQHSEQLATKIWLTVDELSAVGFLLQVVPASGSDVIGIERDIIAPHWERITKLTSSLYPVDLLRVDCQSILRMLYPEEDIRLFPSVEMSFGCTCSRKRGSDAILLLGKDEAEAELKDKQSIVVTCDFCNKEYIFDRIDVAKIFESKDMPPSDIHLH